MKNIVSNFIAALLAVSFASSASAATLAAYYTDDSPKTGPSNPYDYADNLKTITAFNIAGGSGLTRNGEQLTGWGTSIDLQKYAGFKIAAEPGYELLVDLFTFQSSGVSGGPGTSTSYQWGYRIDLNNDGSFAAAGEEWVFGKSYTSADSDFIDTTTAKQWDVDISTTGTVEFGFFGSAPAATGLNYMRTADAIGSVNLVPEPTSVLLSALGGLGLLRRRK